MLRNAVITIAVTGAMFGLPVMAAEVSINPGAVFRDCAGARMGRSYFFDGVSLRFGQVKVYSIRLEFSLIPFPFRDRRNRLRRTGDAARKPVGLLDDVL